MWRGRLLFSGSTVCKRTREAGSGFVFLRIATVLTHSYIQPSAAASEPHESRQLVMKGTHVCVCVIVHRVVNQ